MAAPRKPFDRPTLLIFAALALAGLLVVARGYRYAANLEPEWGTVLMIWGGGLAVLFTVPLFLRAETRVNLLTTLLAIGVTLFVVNLYLTYREPPVQAMIREADELRAKQPNANAQMPFAFAKSQTDAGTPTVPRLTGRIARLNWKPDGLLPLSGVSTATTALCNEPGPYIIYRSDEHGFRNPVGLPRDVDVAVVGDSFAHGECVAEGKDSVELLRAVGYSIRSYGSSGAGPLIQLAIKTEYALPAKPKVLLWYFYEDNDLEDMREELEAPVLVRYLHDPSFKQNLLARQQEVDAHWRQFLGTVEQASFYGSSGKMHELITLTPLRKLIRLERNAHAPWRRNLTRVLAEAKKRTDAAGARLVFVYLPSWGRYSVAPPVDKGEIIAMMKGLGIEVVDFDRALVASKDPLAHFRFRKIGHYNELGYALLAKTIEQEALQSLSRN